MVLTQKQTHRSMELDREPRIYPHLDGQLIYKKEARICNGEQTTSSTNGENWTAT